MKRPMTFVLLTTCLCVSLLPVKASSATGAPVALEDMDQEFSGAWRGAFETPAFSLTMDMALARLGAEWKVEVKFREGGREESPAARDLKVQDAQLSFALMLGGIELKFIGELSGNTLSGTAEGYRQGAKIGTGKWQLSRMATAQRVSEPPIKSAKETADQSVENEREAIRRVIQYYIDVTDKKDAESIKRAFHADTKLMSAGNNGLTQLSLDEWWGRVSRIPGKIERKSRITVLDVTGLAAVAKVDFERSTDYMTLLKINGEWKIVNKVLSTSL